MLPANFLFDQARMGATVTIIDPVASWIPDGYSYEPGTDEWLDDEGEPVYVNDLSEFWTTTNIPCLPDTFGGESQTVIDVGEIATFRARFFVMPENVSTIDAAFAVLINNTLCRVTSTGDFPLAAPLWVRIEVASL